MKKAVVYYSMSGNAEYVANIIAEKTGADLIKLVAKKEYPKKGLRKFAWGGACAVMGETPALEPYEFNAEDYDYIIFGTPVWASSFTPPIRTFLKENKEKLNGKKFAAYVCYLGGGGDKALAKLKKQLGAEFEAELILIDPKNKQTEENVKLIDDFCEKIS